LRKSEAAEGMRRVGDGGGRKKTTVTVTAESTNLLDVDGFIV
jgi:hypothetical protein